MSEVCRLYSAAVAEGSASSAAHTQTPLVLSWSVGGRRHINGERRAPAGALGQGSFELSVFGRPRRRPLGGHVSAGVFGQVVTAHEAPVTHGAYKLLLARVGAAVAGQLVGAGKLFLAALPVAAERLLTCRARGKVTPAPSFL